MSTLTDIESAVVTLPVEQQEELVLFLAEQLRASRQQLPPPRKHSREEMDAWIAEDEADMRRFRESA